MKKDPVFFVEEGQCAGGPTCPLSKVEPGTTVCIKHLRAAPELTERLRELGFCEQQRIKLVSRNSSYICQVCNARLGISEKVADSILVEALSDARPVVAASKKRAKTPEVECSR